MFSHFKLEAHRSLVLSMMGIAALRVGAPCYQLLCVITSIDDIAQMHSQHNGANSDLLSICTISCRTLVLSLLSLEVFPNFSGVNGVCSRTRMQPAAELLSRKRLSNSSLYGKLNRHLRGHLPANTSWKIMQTCVLAYHKPFIGAFNNERLNAFSTFY